MLVQLRHASRGQVSPLDLGHGGGSRGDDFGVSEPGRSGDLTAGAGGDGWIPALSLRRGDSGIIRMGDHSLSSGYLSNTSADPLTAVLAHTSRTPRIRAGPRA